MVLGFRGGEYGSIQQIPIYVVVTNTGSFLHWFFSLYVFKKKRFSSHPPAKRLDLQWHSGRRHTPVRKKAHDESETDSDDDKIENEIVLVAFPMCKIAWYLRLGFYEMNEKSVNDKIY